MKIETALRYAKEIAKRVQDVNGLIPTPRGENEFMKVNGIWVFGSTVKGSQNPNDLDLLIDMDYHGERQSWEKVGYDPQYYRSCGVRCARSSKEEAMKWLTKGMKKVSRHCAKSEKAPLDVKVMIYPKFELVT